MKHQTATPPFVTPPPCPPTAKPTIASATPSPPPTATHAHACLPAPPAPQQIIPFHVSGGSESLSLLTNPTPPKPFPSPHSSTLRSHSLPTNTLENRTEESVSAYIFVTLAANKTLVRSFVLVLTCIKLIFGAATQVDWKEGRGELKDV